MGAVRGLAVILLVVLVLPHAASANPRYAGLVIDAISGEVFYEEHADAQRYPASLTKMMTLYMIFRELDAGRLSLGSTVRFSRHAASLPPSHLGLPAGSTITVEQAIYALITRSANDVAAAVAETIGGTESGFAAMMTEEARRIGMQSTTFRNASGWPDSRQVTTARDMARLAQALQVRFPHHYHYFNTRHWTFRGTTYRNHNRLLGRYDGVDGLKTGYIRASGFNLAASARRGELRVIAVVFGGRTAASRDSHMVDLLDRAFNSTRGRHLIAHGSVPFTPPIPDRSPRGAPIQVASLDGGEAGAGLAGLVARSEAPIIPPLPGTRPVFGQAASIQVASAAPVPLDRPAASVTVGPTVASDAAPIAPARPPGGATAFVLAPPSNAVQTAAPVRPATIPAGSAAGYWGVQIGTFETEMGGLERLRAAMTAHPRLLGGGFPNVVRAETETGTLFRARIYGVSYESAVSACAVLIRQGDSCLTLAPQ